ncbi:MAG: roadblock/LC7 domain-containing protein, partial [Phycisphaerales bacterium]|nr:roadblock/LC7 domain-containing protein [Phycisphaerales bacterium]
MERIQSHKGVVGLVIVSEDGIPIRTTLDNSTTLQYVAMCNALCGLARGVVRDTDPQNDLK